MKLLTPDRKLIRPTRRALLGGLGLAICAPAIVRAGSMSLLGAGKPGGGAAWTPASVSTAFWYDASNFASLTIASTLVSQWNDLSGNGRHLTQATSANRPVYNASALNGLAGIHFVNNNDITTDSQMATATFTLAQPFTLMIVIKSTGNSPGSIGSNGSFAILWDGDIAGAASRAIIFNGRTDTSNDAAYFGGTVINTGVLLGANTGYHQMYVLNGASSSSDINGTTTTAQNAGSAGIANGISFGSLVGNTNGIDCYICEAFCIPSTSQTANALAYVSSKWGV